MFWKFFFDIFSQCSHRFCCNTDIHTLLFHHSSSALRQYSNFYFLKPILKLFAMSHQYGENTSKTGWENSKKTYGWKTKVAWESHCIVETISTFVLNYIWFKFQLLTSRPWNFLCNHWCTWVYSLTIGPGGAGVKNPPSNSGSTETWVQSLGWEDNLEKEMAPHSSILAWKIPWMEEPGGL